MRVREAIEADIPDLLRLMRELARFERYADAFAVTEEVLRKQGFRRSSPDFYCLVAEEKGELLGLLVYYFVPFTYRAKPNIIVKELYVGDEYRGRGVGKLLMKAVAKKAGRRHWFTESGDKKRLEDEEALQNAIRYVLEGQ